jgi:hypothetical protein
VAEGSINDVLDGKHYNRAVRAHKCVYEALMRLAWREFLKWLEKSENERHMVSVNLLLQLISDMARDLKQEVLDDLLKSPLMNEVMVVWRGFLDRIRKKNGSLSALWMTYVDMVEGVVLGLLRASREGNWFLHLHAIRKMIPWCFANDRVNYSRYLEKTQFSLTFLIEFSLQCFNISGI